MAKWFGWSRLSMFLAVSALCFSTCVAQISATASVGISVVIVPGISVTNSKVPDFSSAVKESRFRETLPAMPQYGLFAISGQPGANVSINFPHTIPLEGPDGHSIRLTSNIPVWNAEDSQSCVPRYFPAKTGGNAVLSTDGRLYVWFGGSIDAENATMGTYAGMYTVTISY